MNNDLRYFTMCETYASISNNFYKFYIYYNDKEKTMCNNGGWDYAQHFKNENEEYEECHQLRFRSAVIAVIFQALAIEAYVNFYCYKHFGEEEFLNTSGMKDKNLDVVETSQLWQKINKIFKENSFVYGEDKIQPLIRDLLKKRNDLVHYKTRGFDEKNLNTECFIKHYHNQISFVFDDIDKQITAYELLTTRIAEIDGSGVNIAQQENDIQENIFNGILKKVIKETLDWSKGIQ